MDNYEHLTRLEEQSQKLATGKFSTEAASKAAIVEVSTILTELCTLVKRHLYPEGFQADRLAPKNSPKDL